MIALGNALLHMHANGDITLTDSGFIILAVLILGLVYLILTKANK